MYWSVEELTDKTTKYMNGSTKRERGRGNWIKKKGKGNYHTEKERENVTFPVFQKKSHSLQRREEGGMIGWKKGMRATSCIRESATHPAESNGEGSTLNILRQTWLGWMSITREGKLCRSAGHYGWSPSYPAGCQSNRWYKYMWERIWMSISSLCGNAFKDTTLKIYSGRFRN